MKAWLLRWRRRILFAMYGWIDRRGRIPFWARWIWPRAHWCPEYDYMLWIAADDCGCGFREDRRT